RFARALVLAPTEPASLEQLWIFADKADAWHLAARALHLAAGSAPASHQPALRKKLAEALETHLGAPEQALLLWRQISRDLPSDQQAHQAIERLLQSAGAAQELVANLEARIAGEKDKAQKRRLLEQLVSRLEEQGSDPARALEAYQRILKIDPVDPKTWESLL